MTDEQRKSGHAAIAVLFRAALHPGRVHQSTIIEAQQTLSSLLEKAVSPDTRTLAEKIADRTRRRKTIESHPCGEISLDKCSMGSKNGFDQTDNQQSPKRGCCVTVTCVKPIVGNGFQILRERSEGPTPSDRGPYGFPRTLEHKPALQADPRPSDATHGPGDC